MWGMKETGISSGGPCIYKDFIYSNGRGKIHNKIDK